MSTKYNVVRPSLVPMRDLVPMSNGGRVDSVAGRTGTQWEDSAWDLGSGQQRMDTSVQVQDGGPRRIRGPRTENVAQESDLMISVADY